jgi:hypothetical protein
VNPIAETDAKMCNLGVNNGNQFAYRLIERCYALKHEIHADIIYKFSSRRLKTHYVSMATASRLVLLGRKKKWPFCCENHAEQINMLCGQNAAFSNVKACSA